MFGCHWRRAHHFETYSRIEDKKKWLGAGPWQGPPPDFAKLDLGRSLPHATTTSADDIQSYITIMATRTQTCAWSKCFPTLHIRMESVNCYIESSNAIKIDARQLPTLIKMSIAKDAFELPRPAQIMSCPFHRDLENALIDHQAHIQAALGFSSSPDLVDRLYHLSVF
jgi:hypothetical protein